MACTRPIKLNILDRNGKFVEVKCGHCVNCITEKQQQLQFLAEKEVYDQYIKKHGSAFITLTYNDDNVPHSKPTPIGVPYRLVTGNYDKCTKFTEIHKAIKNERFLARGYRWHSHILIKQVENLKKYKNDPRLEKIAIQTELLPESTDVRDVQKFIKRLRQNMRRANYPAEKDFKTIWCTEYGGKGNRPHAHVIFIGLSTAEVETFGRKAWNQGIMYNKPLTQGGIRYVCKYMMKSKNNELTKIYNRYEVEKPKLHHSIGMGKKWIIDNIEKIYRENFTFRTKTGKCALPKYVKNWIIHRLGLNTYAVNQRLYEQRRTKEYFKWSNLYKTYEDYLEHKAQINEALTINKMRASGLSWDESLRAFKHKEYYKANKQISEKKNNNLAKLALDKDITSEEISIIKLCYYFEKKAE